MLDGYEEAAARSFDRTDDSDELSYQGVAWTVPITRCQTKIDFKDLRNKIIDEMQKCVTIRFSESIDENFNSILPFFEFDRTRADVRNVHKFLAADLDCRSLNLQFKDLCKSNSLTQMKLHQVLEHLVRKDDTKSYTEIITVLARFLAATPHSADVERCISANNCIKTALRSSVKISTENNILFVNMNMPPLVKWSPENAIVHWLKIKKRRYHNLTMEHENRKARKRPYFRGIFPGVTESVNYSDVDEFEDEEMETCVSLELPIEIGKFVHFWD